jgi:hypothetical protein
VRRLPRILINAGTALSLLLCVATAVLWVRSYRYEDRCFGRGADVEAGTFTEIRIRWVESTRGELHFVRSTTTIDRQRPAPPETVRGFAALGFAALTHVGGASPPSGKGSISNQSTLVGVPHWFVAAALLAVAFPGLRRAWQARMQIRASLCPHCGYDLRATPGRCPECGRIFST